MGIQTVRLLALSAIMFTVLLTGGILHPHAATAATYYMATTGSDSNPCTQAQPCATFQHTLGLLTAGDTLYLRGGTYDQVLQTPPSGTAWNTAVTVAGYQGETATVSKIQLSGGSNKQYIIFRDFTVNATLSSNHTPIAILIDNAQYIRFQTLDVGHGFNNLGCSGAGACAGQLIALITMDGGWKASHLEFLNNKVHDSATGDDSHGFYVTGAFNLLDGNEIYNCSGYGIQVYNTFDHTAVHDNIIRNNKVHNNGINPTCCTGGMVIGSGGNNIVYNNIVYNNSLANGIDVGYGGSNNQIYNNTIYGHSGYSINIDSINTGGTTANTVVRNNIVYGNSAGINDNAPSSTIDHNLTTNPSFVNAGAADFRLQATSPAIDAGTNISVVTVDIQGSPRPQGARYDIGAYEYSGSQLPVPKNLRAISVAP